MAMNNQPKASGGGFKMKPGSKGADTPGTFRSDSPLKALGFSNPMPEASPLAQKAKRGPQTKNVGGVRVKYSTKGRSTKNTDLLEEGQKAYKSAKKTASKYYNKAKKWLKS